MSDFTPPWATYLTRNGASPKAAPTFRFEATPMTPLEKAQRQEQGSALGAEYISGQPETGQPGPGLLSKAMRVITFLPSVATSAVKEFIYDPIANIVTPGTTDKVSIKEFMDNVNKRNFATQEFSFLKYDEKAPLWQKFLKEAGGFGIDVLSTGGFGGGVKVASVLGRKVLEKQIANAAETAFLQAGRRAADEGIESFAARASDFGAKSAMAFNEGRSRGVAKLFEETFDNGKEVFKSLPKEVQGGLQVRAFGKTLGSWNSGGYAVDAIANGIGLPQLASTTEKAVKTFQGLKNAARADRIETPVIAGALSKVNALLNSVGGESKQWQKYLQTMVDNADEEDSIRAFKSFSQGVDTVQNLRNVRMGYVQGTKDLLRDAGRLEKADPTTYAKAIAFMKDPAGAATAVLADETDRVAKAFADQYRGEYERFYKLLTDNGFDVGYLENYLPLLYVRSAKADEIAKVLEAGPRGIPGPGYRPEKARTQFMKDKIDPDTKQPIPDPANPGQFLKEPMTPTEIKKMLIERGRKDLADEIQDDPLLQLAQYSTNVSRLLANKSVIEDLVKQGVLVKSKTLQIDLDPTRLEQIISRFDAKKLNEEFKAFATTPGKIGEYLTKLNDDLEMAYRTGDEALIQSVRDRVENLMANFASFDKKLNYQVKKAAQRSDEIERARIKEDKLFLQKAQVALGATGKRAKAEPANMAQGLVGKEGITYKQVGAGEAAAGETFYLPPELAGVAGEEALVDTIERKMLLRNNDKGAVDEFMKSYDQYMQFFRTAATFGKLTGFVLRNGNGAIQNNFVIAGSSWKDHAAAADIAKTRVMTDFALGPLGQLTRTDLSTKRVDKLIKDGRLSAEQAKALKGDIETFGRVQTGTIDRIRDEVLEGLLSKKRIDDKITYWDAYQTALKDGDVYDKYTTLPYMQGLNADDQSINLLGVDPSRIVVRTDRAGAERKGAQKFFEGILNVGVGPDTKMIGNVFSADVAGRNIVIRPTQLTRDFNQVMEEFVRTAPIITGLRKYGNTEQGRRSAAMLMKAAQFDYSNLSEVERKVFRRLMPFYTYSRTNVPAQLRVLMNDPTRIQRNLQFWDAIGNVIGDGDGSDIVLPNYVSQMYGFALNEDYRKELMKDKPAWLQAVLANPIAFRPETPVADIERYTQGGMLGGLIPGAAGVEQIGSSITPPIKAALQVLLQQNLYTGKKYTADDSPAPLYAQTIDAVLRKASNNKLNIGVFRDPDSGDSVMSGKVLDQMKTLFPPVGTFDRTLIPAIQIISGAVSGETPEALTAAEERAVTSALSQLTGLNVTTVTEKTQAAELYNRVKNRKDNVAVIAAQQGIDPGKVMTFTNSLIRQGLDPVQDREQIMMMLDQARRLGAFKPDYLGDMSGL